MVFRVVLLGWFVLSPLVAFSQDPKEWEKKAREWKDRHDRDDDKGKDKDKDKDRDKPEEAPKIDWKSSLGEALNKEKNVLIYVHPPSDSSEIPGALMPENAKTIEKEWNPVKIAWAKDHADLAAYGIKSAPMIVAADRFGNEFKRYNARPGSEDLKALLKAAGDAIAAYAKKLDDDWKKAEELLASRDMERAVARLLSLAQSDKKGYREIQSAQDKIRSIADSTMSEVESQLKNPAGEARGVSTLESMAKWFKGTEHAMTAKLRLARHYVSSGETPKAIAALKQIEKSDEAARMYGEIVERGMAKLRELLTTGMQQGLDVTRKGVKQVQDEFDGTEVARQASEVLKDLSR